MKRLNDGTVSATPPTPPSPGTEGYPTNGNPVGPVPATDVPDWWLALVQEHARGQGDIAGITPSMTGYAEGAERLARVAGAKVVSISSTRALTLADQGLVLVNAASADVTLTLPAANVAASLTLLNGTALPVIAPRFWFVRTDTSGHVVTLQRAGSDTIEGSTSIAMTIGAKQMLRSDASATWYVERPAAGMQVYATAGTFSWTAPPGVYRVGVRLWAAGGGSGACSGSSSGGAAGAGGGFAEEAVPVTPGTAYAVVVGAAGALGVLSGGTTTAGGDGGASSFGGTLVSATGGKGGPNADSAIQTTLANGGVGTSSSGLGHYVAGGQGDQPVLLTGGGGIVVAARGGAAYGTPGAHSGFNSSSSAGIAGLAPGGGASGPVNAASGAAGGAGRVILQW